MKKKLLIYVFAIATVFYSCNSKGDYYYVVYLKDGTKMKSFIARPVQGTLLVMPPWDEGIDVYLSPNEYTKVVYVGHNNDNK